MIPESVFDTLAGGFIGIFSGLAIWIIRDWCENRRRRKQLIDAIDSAARSSTLPVLMSAFSGRTNFFSPAAQFLPVFWRDLALLGTETQMMVVDFFSMTNSAMGSSPPSKELLDALEGMRRQVMKLLELEKAGKRQDVKPR